MLKLPVLPVKDAVIFPYLYMPLSIGREFSKKAIFKAMDQNSNEILVFLQKDPDMENPNSIQDLYTTGTLCKIVKMDAIPKTSSYKLLLQGMERVELSSLKKQDDILVGEAKKLEPINLDLNMEKTKSLYESFLRDLVFLIEKGLFSENLVSLKELENPLSTCYILMSILQKPYDNQKLLESDKVNYILNQTYKEILKQKEMVSWRENIIEQARDSMTKNQKEYFLKEQMKAIKKELGEDQESDVDNYTKKLEEIKKYLSEENHKELSKGIKKLQNSVYESHEISVLKNYLDYVFDLPWYKKTEDKLDIKIVKKNLDSEHYDLVEVKERILEFLSMKKLNELSKGPILCFVGAPGTGKTSIAKALAKAIGRKCVRISLGGVKDESEIRGHRRTFVGSMPGKIIQGMKQTGVMNPVFILDEIDKLSSDFRGDPSSALLEVLDPEQNHTFKDHYINLEYDLSKVMFIATANSLDTIPAALRDRLEIIRVTGYCEEEKLEIAKRFIVPKKTKDSGLKHTDVLFSRESLKTIIRNYTREFGVRELERQISKVCRKIAKKKAEDDLKVKIKVSEENINLYLGAPKFSSIEDNKNGIGIVTGLAWTPVGGEILKLESILIEEKGETILTGRLGEVMQESAKIAVSLIKNNRDIWEIPKNSFEEKRLHIHAPTGDVPKEGPSAGVALASCMVSCLKNKKVKDSVAMTGEITLTGRVLPVGGIKEKVLAAIRSNIKTVLLPIENKKDFEEIPDFLTAKVEVKYVTQITEVLKELDIL